MAKVAREQEELENRIGESEDKRKRTKKALKEALDGSATASRGASPPVEGGDTTKPLLEVPPGFAAKRRQTIAELTNNEISDDESEEEDEFFDAVDAGQVEVVGALPEPPQSPAPTPATKGGTPEISSVEAERRQKEQQISKSYRGYEDGLRKRLKIDADNRPKVSLWVCHSAARISISYTDPSTGCAQVHDRQGHDQDDTACNV